MKEKMKKLYRSNKEKMLCGVCGGMSEYFEIDVTLIRILWVIFACFGGSGIFAYIIAAIIMPDEPKKATKKEI